MFTEAYIASITDPEPEASGPQPQEGPLTSEKIKRGLSGTIIRGQF